MKKTVLLFVIAFVCTGCRWDILDGPTSNWYVKNNTGQTLMLSFYPHDFHIIGVNDVAPDDSIQIASIKSENGQRNLYFEDWLISINHPQYGGIMSFKVFSESDNLLKEWKYENKELLGKQLFNESSWKLYQYNDGRYTSATWVFEIWPEDLIEEDGYKDNH